MVGTKEQHNRTMTCLFNRLYSHRKTRSFVRLRGETRGQGQKAKVCYRGRDKTVGSGKSGRKKLRAGSVSETGVYMLRRADAAVWQGRGIGLTRWRD